MRRAALRQFWLGHIAAWRGSELSQAAYCREHDLRRPSFAYWKRQSERGGEDGVAEVVRPPVQFMAVSLPVLAANRSGVSVFVAGMTVELAADFSPRVLSEVLKVLRDGRSGG